MKVERGGFLERISEHQEEIALPKDTAKAVQSSNEDAMKQVKDAAKKEITAAEQATKRSDLKAQRAAKAAKKAKEGTVTAEAGATTIAHQMRGESFYRQEMDAGLVQIGKDLKAQEDIASHQSEEARRYRGLVSTELPCRKILTMCVLFRTAPLA
jgi:hypothetical protein